MNTTFEQIKNDHRIYIGSQYSDRADVLAEDLIHDHLAMMNVLKKQRKGLDAPNVSITGLLFGKMYSVFAMGFFQSMIEQNIIIDTDPSRFGIELLEEKNRMNFIVPSEAVHKIDELSEEHIKHLIKAFITDHLQPLFQKVAQISCCKSTHMRSIVSHNLHQRKCALEKEKPELQERIDKVFHWLTSDELFKENRRNPLHFDFRYYTANNGKETYVRRHCCMKYMLYDGNKAKCCATCPLISDEERDERL